MAFEDARKTRKPGDIEPDVPHNLGKKAAEDKEHYNYYYNRIYPLVKEGKIDFHKVAEKTGYKERRVRETLLFRLTTGEVLQLFGKKDGFCYICSRRMPGVGNKEPMCLSCLQSVDTAIQELHLSGLTLESQAKPNRSQRTEEEHAADFKTLHIPKEEPAKPAQAHPSENRPSADWVPRAQYEAAVRELDRYKTHYGPMQPVEEPAVAEDESVQATPEAAAAPEPVVNDDFLKILSMDDKDLPPDSQDLTDLADALSGNHEPIRHFGFQRLKVK